MGDPAFEVQVVALAASGLTKEYTFAIRQMRPFTTTENKGVRQRFKMAVTKRAAENQLSETVLKCSAAKGRIRSVEYGVGHTVAEISHFIC